MDLVVKNGTVVSASDIYQADIAVEGEKIASIGHGLFGREVVDATGHYVFPGFVDAHVHLSLPVGGMVSSDDFTRRDDFTQIPNSAPGIETRVPLIYSEGVGKERVRGQSGCWPVPEAQPDSSITANQPGR